MGLILTLSWCVYLKAKYMSWSIKVAGTPSWGLGGKDVGRGWVTYAWQRYCLEREQMYTSILRVTFFTDSGKHFLLLGADSETLRRQQKHSTQVTLVLFMSQKSPQILSTLHDKQADTLFPTKFKINAHPVFQRFVDTVLTWTARVDFPNYGTLIKSFLYVTWSMQ